VPVLFAFMIGCAGVDHNLLVGNWQLIELSEGGAPVEADIQVVRFHFDPNNQYQFHGTLNYKEAGTYYIDEQYLFTVDTLNRATTEKAVQIVHLTPDSLFLKMNDGGKERLMKLVKVK